MSNKEAQYASDDQAYQTDMHYARKETKMNKKTDWWDDHIVVVSTTGDKKLEDKLNKELKKKVLKNLTDKPK